MYKKICLQIKSSDTSAKLVCSKVYILGTFRELGLVKGCISILYNALLPSMFNQ